MINNRLNATVYAEVGPDSNGRSNGQQLKAPVHRQLLENMDLAQARQMPREQLLKECSRRIDQLLTDQRSPLSASDKQRRCSAAR